MTSPVMEMEMERLDMEIAKSKKQFYSAVLRKKRRVMRTWLEISSLTNAHLLQMLPYRAMLSHVAKLAEERDKVIDEILAAKEDQSDLESGEEDNNNNTNNGAPVNGISKIVTSSIVQSCSLSAAIASSGGDPGTFVNQKARDEAVQTEESSFGDQR